VLNAWMQGVVFDVGVISGSNTRPSPISARLSAWLGARYHGLLFFLAVSPIFLSLLSLKPMLVDFLLASFAESSSFRYFNFLHKWIVADSAFIGRNSCSSSLLGRGRVVIDRLSVDNACARRCS